MCGYTLPYDNTEGITQRLQTVSPHLVMLDDVQPANFYALANKLVKVSFQISVYGLWAFTPSVNIC